MSEYIEKVFDNGMSGAALLSLMREYGVKLKDISISCKHVQYFEDWEEDQLIIRFQVPSPIIPKPKDI